MHPRGACTTRAAAALCAPAQRQPRACTCVVHAQTERLLRFLAPLGDDTAPAWCMHDPSGCCACARRSATTPGMHLRGALRNLSGRCACARRSATTPCMHPRGACTSRAAAALARAARRRPVHAPAWCVHDPSG
eukprot:2273474-Pleurochrysis_carterae.AAC.1